MSTKKQKLILKEFKKILNIREVTPKAAAASAKPKPGRQRLKIDPNAPIGAEAVQAKVKPIVNKVNNGQALNANDVATLNKIENQHSAYYSDLDNSIKTAHKNAKSQPAPASAAADSAKTQKTSDTAGDAAKTQKTSDTTGDAAKTQKSDTAQTKSTQDQAARDQVARLNKEQGTVEPLSPLNRNDYNILTTLRRQHPELFKTLNSRIKIRYQIARNRKIAAAQRAKATKSAKNETPAMREDAINNGLPANPKSTSQIVNWLKSKAGVEWTKRNFVIAGSGLTIAGVLSYIGYKLYKGTDAGSAVLAMIKKSEQSTKEQAQARRDGNFDEGFYEQAQTAIAGGLGPNAALCASVRGLRRLLKDKALELNPEAGSAVKALRALRGTENAWIRTTFMQLLFTKKTAQQKEEIRKNIVKKHGVFLGCTAGSGTAAAAGGDQASDTADAGARPDRIKELEEVHDNLIRQIGLDASGERIKALQHRTTTGFVNNDRPGDYSRQTARAAIQKLMLFGYSARSVQRPLQSLRSAKGDFEQKRKTGNVSYRESKAFYRSLRRIQDRLNRAINRARDIDESVEGNKITVTKAGQRLEESTLKNVFETVIDEKRKRSRKRRKKRKASKKKRKGKRDACYYKVKSRYSVWPSAYASGALVKCRRVGAANWGNKSKKNEALELNEKKHAFKAHRMYCPRSGKSEMAKTKEDHLRLKKKGFVHVDPDKLRKVLRDEGGASGMKPFVKATKADEKEIKQALKMMPDVGQHKDKDYILDDGVQIKVVKKTKKKKSLKEAIVEVVAEKKSLKVGRNQKEANEQKVAPTLKASP